MGQHISYRLREWPYNYSHFGQTMILVYFNGLFLAKRLENKKMGNKKTCNFGKMLHLKWNIDYALDSRISSSYKLLFKVTFFDDWKMAPTPNML